MELITIITAATTLQSEHNKGEREIEKKRVLFKFAKITKFTSNVLS